MDEISGEEAASKLVELISGKKFHLHHYIYRQYAELKWLKSNLKIDEVILSVDFSTNYDNKQRHEIQNAYFGRECFTLFTAEIGLTWSYGETHHFKGLY